MVEKGLKDSHIQSWRDQTVEMSKCLNYRLYKSEYKCGKKFRLTIKLRIFFYRFRCMIHRLPIEYRVISKLERATEKIKMC